MYLEVNKFVTAKASLNQA